MARLCIAAAAISVSTGGLCQAQQIRSVRVATVQGTAVGVWHAPGNFSWLYIAEQAGRLRALAIPGNTLSATPFLPTLPNLATGDEAGLLGATFHPNYAANGHVYVFSTRAGGPWGSGTRVVERYTRSTTDENQLDPGSAQTVLRVDYPVTVHNGGWIGFGPDGFLYISIGAGGPATDSQLLTGNLMGKILRVDVNGDDFPADPNRNYRIPPGNPFVGIAGDDEIWLYGLRNPWRCAFDPYTGALFIGDVGQSRVEELDVIPAGVGGLNLGYPCMEGNLPYLDPESCTGTLTPPLLTYRHDQQVPPLNVQGCSIIGGEVYRGCAMPWLTGSYVFADLCHPALFTIQTDGASVTGAQVRTGEVVANFPTSFGTDARGEVYYTAGNGVFRIVPAVPVAPGQDCNANGLADECDLAVGSSPDADHDGLPDECACLSDWDMDGQFTPADIAAFVGAWFTGLSGGTLTADFDHNSLTQPVDLALFVRAWFAAVSTPVCP